MNFSDLKTFDTNANDLAFLPYSSGTTGLPKGVMLSHNNIVANSLQIGIKLPNTAIVQPTTDTFQDVLPSVLPFFHIYGFTVLMASKLALGSNAVTLSHFNPETFLKSLIVHKGTVVHLVPPISKLFPPSFFFYFMTYHFLVNFLGSHPAVKSEHLASIRSVMSGAAPIGTSDAERFLQK